ncbi:MAG: diguanylate cyclase [Solobacterium sp.]|nr:diguanylate cyclase [Solobacterium sp.]
MELQYLIVYFEILLMCFIFCGVMLFNVRHDIGSDWEVITFKSLLYTLMIAVVVDGITHAQYRGFLHLSPLPIAILYAIYMFLMGGLMGFLWFVFAEMRLGTTLSMKKWYFVLSLIPVLISAILCFGSIKTGWLFQIDDQAHYSRGPYWMQHNFIPYIYFAFTTLHAFILAKKQVNPIKRRQFYILSAFIISPFFGALLQLFIGSHPFVAPASTIAVFFIFISLQGNMINHDSLTGLNNRLRCNQYLDSLINSCEKGNGFYTFIMDINKFKQVNDTYGHIEGDKALRLAANVLRDVTDEYKGEAGRFGGDEFVAFIKEKYLEKPEDFSKVINERLKEACLKQNIPYILSFSVGYYYNDDNKPQRQELLDKADQMLYEEKAAR